MSNRSCFACGVECVRSKSVGYIGARRTMTVALKRTSGAGGGRCCFVKGCVVYLVQESW